MPAPTTTDEFLEMFAKSELLALDRLEEYVVRKRADQSLPAGALKTAQALIQDGLLTKYQAEQLLGGRYKNFIIGGKYRLLERLGKGGMALVFLCEHEVMKRRVALKILPKIHAEDKELLGRFHREARALSSLRHPNIVGAYDADQANKVHFLVMEFVDGGDLDQIVQKIGPLAWERAANYIEQAAHGLQHAHECGLVHRDIKPGNLLVDRSGTVKLLDLGLARIFHETTDDLTTGRDVQTLLGTVDYLAPEQAVNSHDVDIRADIYGLGATFYYILTGKGLFEDGTVAQKLSWHLHRPPAPISNTRPDVPEGLLRVVDRMLAKDPDDRYQTPDEVVEALEPWTRMAIGLPDSNDFPQLSRAARGFGQPSNARMSTPSVKIPLSNPPRNPFAVSRDTKVISEDGPAKLGPTASKPKLESTLHDIPSLPEEGATAGRRSAGTHRRRHGRRAIVPLIAGLVAISLVGGLSFFGPNRLLLEFSRPGLPIGKGEPGASGLPSTASWPSSSALIPSVDQPPEVSITLTSESKPNRTFDTLLEAVKSAKAGDRVLVTGSLLVDSIELSDVEGVPRDLTIEGVNSHAKGQPVRWRAPQDHGPGRPLLDVTGLLGFHLKNFLFDGQGRVLNLVRISGRGAGSTLEDLQFQGSTRAGIVLRGWAGESGLPSVILGARFSTSERSEAAILIESDIDRPTVGSEFVRILSCSFVGPFQAALLVGGPVDGMEVEQCRFFRVTDGLCYRRGPTRDPIRVRMVNNTFSELQRGLHFETTPPSASSELVVSNNLFANTTRTATLDRVSVEPARIAANWIWTEEGKKTPTVPPGVRQFRKSFDVPSVPPKANLDISCDETFTVWLNGHELMKNPSAYYTQRVFSIDVTKHLQPGPNVLAVQGTNRLDRLDSKFGTTAGLLAQVTVPEGRGEVVLIKTDQTWKCSEQAPEGWTSLDFDDQSWTSARRWQDDHVTWPWKFAVWDSVVQAQLKDPLEPILVVGSGNIRDYRSWEGYPALDSERVVLQENELPKNPANDAAFLRYSANHPLASAGPGGVPIGAFEER